MAYKIITHSGKAHFDEIIASALLVIHMGELPYEVIRLGHGEVERLVEDSAVPQDAYLVDCGMRFEPHNRLFDHHHDKDIESTALLILRHFFPHLEKTGLIENFRMISDVDRYGESVLPDWQQVSESREYWKFHSRLFLKSFEMNPFDTLKLISASLRQVIEFEQVRDNAKIWINTPGKLIFEEVEGLMGLVYVEVPPHDVAEGLHSVDAEIIQEKNISFVYGFDKEDANIRNLFRTQIGKTQLDFSRCRPEKNIFAHRGGFLLKFFPASSFEWRKMIRQAVLN